MHGGSCSGPAGRRTPGWRPYYNVIVAACANLGVTLEVERVS